MRWAVTTERDWTRPNALVPLVLPNRTTLDAVFPRMAGIELPASNDMQLAAASAVCAADIAHPTAVGATGAASASPRRKLPLRQPHLPVLDQPVHGLVDGLQG